MLLLFRGERVSPTTLRTCQMRGNNLPSHGVEMVIAPSGQVS
jgi:hypothetical protein